MFSLKNMAVDHVSENQQSFTTHAKTNQKNCDKLGSLHKDDDAANENVV